MKNNPRILIVDDEAQIRRVLKISLVSHGYNTRLASDGISAIDICREWQPDLVVTDLSMPDMDGLELCRTLRADSQIPIIAFSAGGKEHIRAEALDAGADDYLTKPFGISELLARIRALLSSV